MDKLNFITYFKLNEEEKQDIFKKFNNTNNNYEYKLLENGKIEITKYIGKDNKVAIPKTIDGKFVESIGRNAFCKCEGLSTLEIPDSVISIGNFAFADCTSLTEVVSLGRATSIGAYAFFRCRNLKRIILPNSVKSIGTCAFGVCYKLSEIIIPKSVINIDEDVFCKNTAIEVDEENPNYSSKHGSLFNKDKTKLIRYGRNDNTYNIPASVKKIGSFAFNDCDNLVTVRIPDSVMNIDKDTFEFCSSLKRISIPKRLADKIDISENIIEARELKVKRNVLAVGGHHYVGIKSNGSVIAIGKNTSGQCDVKNWSNIVSVAAGKNCTVGLKSDGTIVVAGYIKLSDTMTDRVAAVATLSNNVIGVKVDGMIVDVNRLFNSRLERQNIPTLCRIHKNHNEYLCIENWVNVIDIALVGGINAFDNIAALKSDGTVVVAGDKYGLFFNSGIENWNNVIAISGTWGHLVGLKSDGSVVAWGKNDCGECNVKDWNDIISIGTGIGFTAGLKSDGTVLLAGDIIGKESLEQWRDIIAISAGEESVLGLKSDGSVVGTGVGLINSIAMKKWKLDTADFKRQ